MAGGQCIRDVCKADKRRHAVQGWAALLPGTLSHPESIQERDLFHGFPTRRHQLGHQLRHQTHLDPRSSLSSHTLSSQVTVDFMESLSLGLFVCTMGKLQLPSQLMNELKS